VAPQFAKQLLKVRKGNLLALTDGGKCYRSVALAQTQIYHCSDRKTAFGGESHCILLQSKLVD
jgi:hypothetical protein